MTHGSLEDVLIARKYFPEEEFLDALAGALGEFLIQDRGNIGNSSLIASLYLHFLKGQFRIEMLSKPGA